MDPAVRDCAECGQLIPATDPLIGYVFDGKYRVVDQIGRGGMAIVYWADDLSTPAAREVALKLLNPDLLQDERAVERFRREAMRASQVRHPNAVRVIEHGEFSDGLLFMAMERLHGTPLSELIRQERTLEAKRAVRLMVQISGAVGEAHRVGLVHRDLKPDNVIVEPGVGSAPERAVVLDFGIAKAIHSEPEIRRRGLLGRLGRRSKEGSEEEDSTLTRDGFVMGTPGYMSPEQSAGQGIDARSDVFSLGLMLFEMLAGELPWESARGGAAPPGDGPAEPMRLRTLREVKPHFEPDPELERILQMALAWDKGWRYADAAALMVDLERYHRMRLTAPVHDRTTQAVKGRVTDRISSQVGKRLEADSRRRRKSWLKGIVRAIWWSAGAALVLACIGVALWVATSEGGRQRAAAELSQIGRLSPAVARKLGIPATPGEPSSAAPSEPARSARTPAQALADGDRALAAQDWARAASAYEQAIDGGPPSPRAWLGLATARIGLKRFEDAQFAFVRAGDLLEGSNEKGAKQRLAEIKALATRNAKLDQLPNDAKHSEALGDANAAAAAYQEYLDARPWEWEIELRLGAVLARSNHLSEAIPHLERAVAKAPDSAEAHLELGTAYLRVKQSADAVRELEKALDLAPDLPDARRQLEIARALAAHP